MKRNPSQFLVPRLLFSFVLCSIGLLLALFALAFYPGGTALAQKPEPDQAVLGQADVVRMVGPVSQDLDLRKLPYVAPKTENEGFRLTRHPWLQEQTTEQFDPILPYRPSSQPLAMPTPLATFPGITSAQSTCGCLPPDTHGDVGPNHYIQAVNSRIKITNKAGTELLAPTTYNTFFSALGAATPCGNQNKGDGFVFYDHLADRWVVSDFAFSAFPGTSFYQCIGVSKTADPVAGGWWLYALQVDPANPNFLGDYPKFGLWPDAYYLSVNLFSNNTTFNGVRVFALPRAAMINGTGVPSPGAVAFTITPANLGDAYSLVPATFRTGSAPPVGTPEYFMAINSPANAGIVQTQVFTWRFHVDFATPANSTFGLGAGHTPNGSTTVAGFVDAFTTTGNIVPQPVTAVRLDTLGDKIMTPLVYQNRGGTESLWASHTVNNNQNGTGPTGIRWYQFNVTGSTIPATPVQQQTFNNGADGLWRWMPSIAVDTNGNMAIGYSTSSTAVEPSIRYAGRLATDPANDLGQGEAVMTAGGGHQTSTSGRWGDYSALSIDPSDNLTFWHTHEYYSGTSNAAWNTRIGNFKFPAGAATPTPTPTPTVTPTPTPGPPILTPTPTPTPGPPTPTPTPTATPAATPCAFSQNFDGVTAPALPAGWVAANAQGAAPLWVTSATTPDTAPNGAFVDDPAVVTDKRLDTPGIAISIAAAQVSFRNFYILESGFDGGVLEVSSPNIAGGAFTDITSAAVGGSFAAGGYNATISTAFSSPIAARAAWSGNSGTYINTVANLGPNVVGQTIKLRFRMATDVSVTGTGWRIDTVSVTGVACPPCGELGSWATVANYPVAIQVPAVGTDGTFVYSAAGFTGGASNALYRYDPVANNWTTLASMPASLWFGRGVYAANTNSFYVLGGFDGTSVLNTTYRYNVATNTWSTGAAMPSGRYDSNIVYYTATGKIYVVGGFDSGFVEANQTWEYDPVANTWNTSRANIPMVMAGSGTSIAGQFIYLAGTWGGGTGSTLHYRYDIVANTWTLMAPVPVAMSHPATGAVSGKLYVIGGGNAFRPAPGLETGPRGMRAAAPDVSYNSTYIYDIAGNSWTSGPNTNVARSYAEGAAIGNRLLVVGGYNSATDTDTNTVETNVVGSCPCPSSRVLIVYADTGAPTSLPAALAAEPGIASVTLFNGETGTPTLAQLQQYDIVVPWSNTGWSNQTTLGNNLGSYLAGGGIVVALNFDWFGGPQSILGTWSTTYTPFNNPGTNNFAAGSLGACTFAPLCSGVSTLNAFYRMTMTLASGATPAGTWNDGTPMIAYKGRAIGISAYVGDFPNNYSGRFSRLIANAGAWLTPPCTNPTPTPTPTPPPTVSISGTVIYCANPSLGPVQGVTMTRTGTSGGVIVTNGAGDYTFSGLFPGGSYTVTPSKTALAPASNGIDGVDVLAVTRHFLNLGSPLAGCPLTAADLNGDTFINGIDAVAVQRFFLGFATGIANAGQYQFTPANRSYSPLVSNQTSQNYNTLVFGDVASTFVHRPESGPSQEAAGDTNEIASTVAAITLPDLAVDRSRTNFTAAVTTSAIDGKNKLVGFQGDFTFDERVVAFESEPVRKAGLTAGNWNVSGNVLPGPGPIRTLRVLGYSLDFTPLSGTGTLFELQMSGVDPGTQGTPLTWAAPPNHFLFIDADLNTQKPGQAAPGSISHIL